MEQLDLWTTGAHSPRSTVRSRPPRPPATNTRLAYAADLRALGTWCHGPGRAAEFPVPAATVAAYLRHLWETLERRRSTVERAMFAIGAAHAERGLPNPIHEPAVKTAWRAILAANERVPERKASLLTDGVRTVLQTMHDETPRDEGEALRVVRDRAIILMLFAGALKRDELRTLDFAQIALADDSLRVMVAAGDRRPRAVHILPGDADLTDPLRALANWLRVSDIRSGPVFRAITAAGELGTAPLDRRSLTRAIKSRCERAGLDPNSIATMSLRTGFVVEATRGGASIDAIAKHTGHQGLGVRHIEDLVDRGQRLRDDHPGRALGL